MSTRRDLLAMAGKKTRATMEAVDRPASRENIPEIIEREPFRGVLFASEAAKDLAIEAGLSWRDFAQSTLVPSSRNGYTSKDVRRLLK